MTTKIQKALEIAINKGVNPTSCVCRWVERENEKIEVGYCDSEQFKLHRSNKSRSLFFDALSQTNSSNDFCLHFKRYTNEGVASYLFGGVIDGSGQVLAKDVIHIDWSSKLVCKLNKNNVDNLDPDLLELFVNLSQIFVDNPTFAFPMLLGT